MGSVTIKDIAKALNLSTSTVSRALRDSYEISTETKNLVVNYAKEVNYHPNPIALSLKENKSWSIGVIVPEIANNFFSNLINGIDEIAHERNYHVTIYQSKELLEREKDAIIHAFARKYDGLIISLADYTDDLGYIKDLQDNGYNIVFCDRVPDSFECHKVVASNFKGAFEATEHLIKNGRKKIAHITSARNLSTSKERLNGYLAALEKHGIPKNDDLIIYCASDSETAFKVIKDMMLSQNPDAFFTASDRLALHCYAAINELNLKVPDDIAFIGFTNLKEAYLLSPPLTTVIQPALEMGRTAGDLLINLIENKKKITGFQNIELATTLQIRESSS